MIISKRVSRTNSRIRKCCTLVLALAILPIGLTYAQDYEAVGKRLKEAVNAGELTGEQAHFMIGALKLAENLQPKSEASMSREQFDAAAVEIKEALVKGLVSEKDARARLHEMRQAMAGAARELEAERKVQWDAIQQEIEGAVGRGNMTREQAKERYEGLKKRLAADQDAVREPKLNWDNVKKRIEGAVERGDMTRKQADEKYKSLKQRLAADQDAVGMPEMNWDNAKQRIEGAVERGDMTRQQADEKYNDIKEQMAAGNERKRDRERWRVGRDDFEKVEADLKAAVESGRISRDDAKKRLQGRRIEMEGENGADTLRVRLAVTLSESGIKREKLGDVLRAIERIAGEMQSEGDEFELDSGMSEYLEKLGLSDDQKKLVLKLSTQIVN